MVDLREGMVGAVSLFIGNSMTGVAILRRTSVSSPGVTGRAIRRLMCSGQWESRKSMVVGSLVPAGGFVATCTVKVEARFDVRGIRGRIELFHVAKLALFTSSCKRAGRMATGAVNETMRPSQWEIGLAMVDNCWRPGRSCVTNLTFFIEILLSMVWIVCTLVIGLMASKASRRKSVELPAGVTRFARCDDMRSG
jgi:hypothetical protein